MLWCVVFGPLSKLKALWTTKTTGLNQTCTRLSQNWMGFRLVVLFSYFNFVDRAKNFDKLKIFKKNRLCSRKTIINPKTNHKFFSYLAYRKDRKIWCRLVTFVAIIQPSGSVFFYIFKKSTISPIFPIYL